MDGVKAEFFYRAYWCVYRRNVIGAVSQAGFVSRRSPRSARILCLLLPIRGAGRMIFHVSRLVLMGKVDNFCHSQNHPSIFKVLLSNF